MEATLTRNNRPQEELDAQEIKSRRSTFPEDAFLLYEQIKTTKDEETEARLRLELIKKYMPDNAYYKQQAKELSGLIATYEKTRREAQAMFAEKDEAEMELRLAHNAHLDEKALERGYPWHRQLKDLCKLVFVRLSWLSKPLSWFYRESPFLARFTACLIVLSAFAAGLQYGLSWNFWVSLALAACIWPFTITEKEIRRITSTISYFVGVFILVLGLSGNYLAPGRDYLGMVTNKNGQIVKFVDGRDKFIHIPRWQNNKVKWYDCDHFQALGAVWVQEGIAHARIEVKAQMVTDKDMLLSILERGEDPDMYLSAIQEQVQECIAAEMAEQQPKFAAMEQEMNEKLVELGKKILGMGKDEFGHNRDALWNEVMSGIYTINRNEIGPNVSRRVGLLESPLFKLKDIVVSVSGRDDR